MGNSRPELVLISDFNLANFANILRAREDLPWEVRMAPLNQVVQALADPGTGSPAALVWTSPGMISTEFRKGLDFAVPDEARALAETDDFARMLLDVAGRWHALYLPSWQIPASFRFGNRELHAGQGMHYLLGRMNDRLAERLSEAPNIFRMHAARWLQAAGDGAWSDPLWYLTKTPFSNAVFRAAADDLGAMAAQQAGHGIKLIVLDLDDTLWGGIVGDDGWENLHLGGHDPVGESMVDFQRALKGLKERGIMLAIASKNNEEVALEAMAKHPEMVLRPEDFVAMRINWNDKASNIADMVRQLNIGLQSVLFIDDNPVERSRVRGFLPEVHVPEWPANKLHYSTALKRLPLFNLDAQSREDAERTLLYQREAQREESRGTCTDVQQWLASLGTKVQVAKLNQADLARVHQLFGKTNQFNLTTRRWTEQELRQRMEDPDRPVWSFRVSDRFGDAGLTGILGLDLRSADTAVIEDLVLSCRVLGRKVEETILHVAVKQAGQAGKKTVRAHFMPTPKNKPCLEFMQRSGFGQDGDDFSWAVAQPYEKPTAIDLEDA